MDAQIRVGHQHPLGGGHETAQHGKTAVDPGAEPEVPTRVHHEHVRRRAFRQQRGKRTTGTPRCAVVDDDYRCGAVVEEGTYTLSEQRTGVVIDHDGAHGGGVDQLRTPW
jgi:hypothetical protein